MYQRVAFGILTILVVAGLMLWTGMGNGYSWIGDFAADQQRSFQGRIARTLRALRAGEFSALASLLGACFAYGFFHAVGPGHGKILIGGYGASRRVSAFRLALVTLASSLGQAVSAVILAFGGLLLLRLTRDQLVGVADRTMAPISYGAIVLVGLWLIWRGFRRLIKSHHIHDHDGQQGEVCSTCGHRHAPTAEEIEGTSLKETLAIIFGIAIRPCTGALFVLIITWQMGIPFAGVAGAFAMALGTACVTLAVGFGASVFRSMAVLSGPTSALAAPLLELVAGTVVVILASGLLFRALA